ncbi:putative lipoprotein YiaD precursor [Mucisphaera calidilacus]|uniref:Putative lipoprotein YiaD n=2 Tax=Mucisphaera calidilacus TaxID=2527982 RepID=A0A518BWJ7_9BACT|nr:putative lipoprotein YiaD precursor [Mucisphaera calidilacus]
MARQTRMLAGLLAVVMLLVVGCQPNRRVLEEREALYIQNQELQEQLNGARTALEVCERDRSNLLDEIERLKRELAAKPEVIVPDNAFAGIAGIETEATDTQIKVRVPGDVLFASGSVELKADSKNTLSEIARVIRREYPNQLIRVEGHTDNDPIRKSEWEDNLELSLQRSAAVHRHLQSAGLKMDRMYAAGFGEARPASTKERSRRVEIVVLFAE